MNNKTRSILQNIHLKGITWNHSRGYTPMVATAQRFNEQYPFVSVQWHKRTLQEFADKSIDELIDEFDLLVIDHPWTGFAAEHGLFVPLSDHLPREFLNDLQQNSVGASFESYLYQEKLWSLPIDAAAPVASYREDLFRKKKWELPENFNDLLVLAEKGNVIFPAIPIDTLMHFYMFCATLGNPPFSNEDEAIDMDTGIEALELFKSLADKTDKRCFQLNPINIYELMALSDDLLYCPFAYGYSNYARPGYAKNTLTFTDLISLNKDRKFISAIGGTGIAVSQKSENKCAAIQYAQYVASGICQKSIYVETGGQPAHREAWKNGIVNRITNNYFTNTLPTLDRAYLRPRYNGYMYFQDRAGDVIRDFLMNGGSVKTVLQQLNKIYRQSKMTSLCVH